MILSTRSRKRFNRSVVSRRGAATVEFALVASAILLPMYVGLSTFSRVFDVDAQLHAAVREGARLAAMDRSGVVPAGQTTNSKVASDIKAFLESSGIPSSHVDVAIKGPYVPSNPPIFDLPEFDLDSVANDSKLFVVEAKVSLSDVYGATHDPTNTIPDTRIARIVFRNGQATTDQ
jgi:TadE-like protein